MTSYLYSDTCIRLFLYAIHVVAYKGALSTDGVFCDKSLGNNFPKKQLRNLLRNKKNISVDKNYPQRNTVNILHRSFFSLEVKHNT